MLTKLLEAINTTQLETISTDDKKALRKVGITLKYTKESLISIHKSYTPGEIENLEKEALNELRFQAFEDSYGAIVERLKDIRHSLLKNYRAVPEDNVMSQIDDLLRRLSPDFKEEVLSDTEIDPFLLQESFEQDIEPEQLADFSLVRCSFCGRKHEINEYQGNSIRWFDKDGWKGEYALKIIICPFCQGFAENVKD